MNFIKYDSSKVTQDMKNLLTATASANSTERAEAITRFGSAIELPIRQGVIRGNNATGIFEVEMLEPGVTAEYPIDIIAPGCNEQDFRAFTNPGKGRIPESTISGDCVVVQQYCIANSIDWYLKFAKNARWDIISRAMEVMVAGFVKKMNDDQWHTLLAAAADRNRMVYDASAAQGQLTRRLLGLSKCVMKRFGCGNAHSVGTGALTDVYLGCEAMEEVHNWGIDQVADIIRAELYRSQSSEDNTVNITGVRLHETWEFGVGQEYQDYFVNQLGGALVPNTAPNHTDHSDVELAIGLDLRNR